MHLSGEDNLQEEESSIKTCNSLPNCDENTNFLQLPDKKSKRQSIVSFSLDSDYEKEITRSVSSYSTLSKSSRYSVFNSVDDEDFSQTLGRLGILICIIVLFVIIVFVYNWWDHVYNN